MYISSSSPGATSEEGPENPIHYGSGRCFRSMANDDGGEWWQVTLNHYSCHISSYRIKTYSLTSDNAHLKSWYLFSGMDENSLTQIDTKTNVSELNKPDGEVTINLKHSVGPLRTLRLQTIATHFIGGDEYDHVMRLGEFDVYGQCVYINPRHQVVCRNLQEFIPLIFATLFQK